MSRFCHGLPRGAPPLLAAFLSLLQSIPVFAGNTLQVYAGTANTRETAVNIDVDNAIPPLNEQVQVSDHYRTVGTRYVHWLRAKPWLGLAAEVSHFHVESAEASIGLVPVCASLSVRRVGDTFEPYGGVGVCAANYEIDVPASVGLVEAVSDLSIASGWDLRAGVSHAFSARIAGFLEYRYTRFDIEYEHRTNPVPPSTASVDERIAARPASDHLLAGLAYQF